MPGRDRSPPLRLQHRRITCRATAFQGSYHPGSRHLQGRESAQVTRIDAGQWAYTLILAIVPGRSTLKPDETVLANWASPNAKRAFRLISPGSMLAVAVWLIASGLFALYVAHFGSYDKVGGSLAAVIIFLVWMWISDIAVLLGAEFNAELERGRAIAGGLPPGKKPFELRDTRKLRKTTLRRPAA
jgi:hypothetical protein